MKSRFEIENDIDFATLDADARLECARKFADVTPMIISEAYQYGRALTNASEALDKRIKQSKDSAECMTAFEDYASTANAQIELFTSVMSEIAFRLGYDLQKFGLRPDSNEPPTKTRQ